MRIDHGQRAAAILCLAVVSCDGAATRSRRSRRSRRATSSSRRRSTRPRSPATRRPQRLDPGEIKLKKNIGLAYMAMYQPGSKHPKDLEFADQGHREPAGLPRRSTPTTRRAQEFLVSMYLATDRYDEAIGFYEDMLKTNPKDAKAMGSIAADVLQEGRLRQGHGVAEEAGGAGARQPRALHHDRRAGLGPLLPLPGHGPGRRGRKIIDEGMDALQKALKIKPDNFEAITYINLLYREKAKMETDRAKKQEYIADGRQVPGSRHSSCVRSRLSTDDPDARNRPSRFGVLKGREEQPCLKTPDRVVPPEGGQPEGDDPAGFHRASTRSSSALALGASIWFVEDVPEPPIPVTFYASAPPPPPPPPAAPRRRPQPKAPEVQKSVPVRPIEDGRADDHPRQRSPRPCPPPSRRRPPEASRAASREASRGASREGWSAESSAARGRAPARTSPCGSAATSRPRS